MYVWQSVGEGWGLFSSSMKNGVIPSRWICKHGLCVYVATELRVAKNLFGWQVRNGLNPVCDHICSHRFYIPPIVRRPLLSRDSRHWAPIRWGRATVNKYVIGVSLSIFAKCILNSKNLYKYALILQKLEIKICRKLRTWKVCHGVVVILGENTLKTFLLISSLTLQLNDQSMHITVRTGKLQGAMWRTDQGEWNNAGMSTGSYAVSGKRAWTSSNEKKRERERDRKE